MVRSSIQITALLLGLGTFTASAQDTNDNIVYVNRHFEQTGISVSQDGRLFVNYPRWSDRYLNAVIEKTDAGDVPYPNLEWNRWDGKPQTAGTHFVCVQAVVADRANTLWVVDAAAPLLTSPVPNGPKLVRIDLATNQVSEIIPIGPDVALPDSYLNDIRIDNSRNFAYLTDSGHGGIIVVDISNGKAWRKLDGHPSVLGDPNIPVVIKGFELRQPNGKPAIFNSDSLEMSKDGDTLFYKAINSTTLWMVPTALLRDQAVDAASGVKAAATDLFPTDGLWLDSHGRIYLSDVEHFAVRRLTLGGGIETIFQSDLLDWPDTFAEDPNGNIYISASRLDEQPRYHDGYSVRHGRPYEVFELLGVDSK